MKKVLIVGGAVTDAAFLAKRFASSGGLEGPHQCVNVNCR
jgi:hypothetical protein